MTKKKRPNACRGHLYGGSEAGCPPPISRKRTLSPRRGRLASALRRLALFPAVVKGFAMMGGRRGSANLGTRSAGIGSISGQKTPVRVLVGSLYSSGLSVIVLQEPTETFATTNRSTDVAVL